MAIGVGDRVLADGVAGVVVRTSRLGADSLIDLPGRGHGWCANELLTDQYGEAIAIRRAIRRRRLALLFRQWRREHDRRHAYRNWLHDGCRGSIADHLPGRPDPPHTRRGSTATMELTVQERLELRSQLRGVGYLCDEFGRVLDEDEAWEPVWQEIRELIARIDLKLHQLDTRPAAA
jgi:hypothetical protein